MKNQHLSSSILFSYIFSFAIGSEPGLKESVNFIDIEFEVITNGNSLNRFIWLHGDEKTAKMALEYHISNYEGTAFFIKNENREVPYKSTIVDPNRIFSRSGTYAALKKFKPYWKEDVLKQSLDEIDEERDSFLKHLFPSGGGYLISVHNNFRGYNVHKEEGKSQKSSIKPNQNPRDFIICTHQEDYDKLYLGPYNIVLQNKLPKEDDGSLSWEALRRNVRYLNIETRLGYLSKQKKMLKFIEDTLK